MLDTFRISTTSGAYVEYIGRHGKSGIINAVWACMGMTSCSPLRHTSRDINVVRT